MFPVDPRDFVNQAFIDSVDLCSSNLDATDPPAEGGYLYSWSLGIPFLKRLDDFYSFVSSFNVLMQNILWGSSVLTSFYYGNLTHPSQDPPRVGFLSTVPRDADSRLKAAVKAAAEKDGKFPGEGKQSTFCSVENWQLKLMIFFFDCLSKLCRNQLL
jgi:phytepsin